MALEDAFSAFLAANDEAQVSMGAKDNDASPWAGSPFEWMMRLPSRRRGKAGELLAAAWLGKLGFSVTRPRNGGHDRVVNDHPVEVKMSTLWAGGNYVFQQFRDQDYEYAFLLGFSPKMAHSWLVPKDIIFSRAIPQHGGTRGTDTRWLSFRAASPPEWLHDFGGSLSACIAALEATLM